MSPTTAWLGLGALALAGLLLVAGLALYWRRGGAALLGPLFAHEVVLLVRRPAHVILRCLFLLGMLVVLGWVFLLSTNNLPQSAWERLTQPVVPAATMADFSLGFFLVFAAAQFLFLCALTARVSAAAVAEDRERHRLDFLLSTPLENHEVVLGKVAARLATAFLLALAGVPVLSVLPFFGGVYPLLVAGVVLFTVLTMVGVAAVGAVFSIYAPNTRQALDGTFTFFMGYHLVSGLPYGLAVGLGLAPGPLLNVLWLLNSGNVVAIVAEVCAAVAGGEPLDDVMPVALLRYAVFHALLVLFCGRIAVTRLRTAARERNEKRPDPLHVRQTPRDEFISRFIYIATRPPVGDDPILWKATYLEDDMQPRHGQPILRIGRPFEKSRDQVLRWCAFGCSLLVPTALGWCASWASGYHGDRVEVANMAFRGFGTLIGAVAWMRMTMQACATVAVEREQRTLPDLFVTDLGRREILQQKWRGAMRLGLWPMAWVAGCGVATVGWGGLHIVGLVLFLAAWMLYAVLLVNLALWCSTISPTKRLASRRLLLTLTAAGGVALLLFSTVGQNRLLDGLLISVMAPLVLFGSGVSGAQLREVLQVPDMQQFAAGTAAGLAVQGVLAWVLWRATVRRFEAENAETVVGH